jgi:hypothetical protein
MVPFDTFEIRVSLQKLLIALIVILVPLDFIGLYLSSESNTSAEQTIETLFKTIAQVDGTAAFQFVNDRVIDVGGIAMDPAVVNAVVKANQSYARMSDEAANTKIAEVEEKWDTPKTDALVNAMLSSAAARLLGRRRELDPRFLKIIVVDQNGVPVAATDKPLHYAPANQVYWQAVSAQGKGSVYVTEVLYDEQSKADYIGIGFPVYDESSRRFIGAVNALVDVSTFFLHLNQTQAGLTARTLVVRDDGTVVSAPNVTLSMKLKAEEYMAVHDALGTMQGRQAGYVVTTMRRGGNRIVGFADTGLKQNYSNLPLIVMVSQDEREALAPVRTVWHFAMVMVLVGLIMVAVLGAYFFSHRKQQV